MAGRWRWYRALAGRGFSRSRFLALYACLALLFRPAIEECVRTVDTQPGLTALAALLTLLLTPLLVALLFVTLIGIAAVPFILAALFCAGIFGKAVMLAWLGRRVVGQRSAGPLGHPAAAVLIGGVIVLALYLVPFIGFVVYKLLDLFGLGAVVYTLALRAQDWRAARRDPPRRRTPRRLRSVRQRPQPPQRPQHQPQHQRRLRAPAERLRRRQPKAQLPPPKVPRPPPRRQRRRQRRL